MPVDVQRDLIDALASVAVLVAGTLLAIWMACYLRSIIDGPRDPEQRSPGPPDDFLDDLMTRKRRREAERSRCMRDCVDGGAAVSPGDSWSTARRPVRPLVPRRERYPRAVVTSGAFRRRASLIDAVRAPPMSSCVMKFAVRNGVA